MAAGPSHKKKSQTAGQDLSDFVIIENEKGQTAGLDLSDFVIIERKKGQTAGLDLSDFVIIERKVKVTVEHESQALNGDSEQGTVMPFKPERKTSPSSPPSPTSSIDELVGAEEEQKEEEEKEDKEKAEKDEDFIARDSVLHKTLVKKPFTLSRSGISSIIGKDVLKSKMNPFSLGTIKLRFQDFFLQGKWMCCRPFKEKNSALQKTPVILHAHFYDDIEGNCELVKRQEEEQEFVPAHPEQQFVIKAADGDLIMTCYVKETVIGGPAVVSFDKLIRGSRICEPFELDFPNQSESVAVSLKVGQNKKLEVNFLFRLEDRRERASSQDQEQLQVASTLQTLHITSRQSTGETLNNISGRQEDFDEKLKVVAQRIVKHEEIDNLGKALNFKPGCIQRYIATNMKNPGTSWWGTLLMLREWRKKQTEATQCKSLKDVIIKAGQNYLADELFGTS